MSLPRPPQVLAFREALQAGDCALASALLADGLDPDDSGDGATPLIHAIHRGDEAMARLLLAHGANPNRPNAKGVTPLMSAASLGNAAFVALLTPLCDPAQACERDGWTPLMHAAARSECGSCDALRFLASRSDPNAQDFYGRTALHLAVLRENAISARFLAPLTDICLLDQDGLSALSRSVFCQTPEVFAAVFSRSPQKAIDSQDLDGHTALMHAVDRAAWHCVRALAPVSDPSLANDRGETAFDIAAALVRGRWSAPREQWEALELLSHRAPDEAIRRAANDSVSLARSCPPLAARIEGLALRDAIGESAPAPAACAETSARAAAVRRL